MAQPQDRTLRGVTLEALAHKRPSPRIPWSAFDETTIIAHLARHSLQRHNCVKLHFTDIATQLGLVRDLEFNNLVHPKLRAKIPRVLESLVKKGHVKLEGSEYHWLPHTRDWSKPGWNGNVELGRDEAAAGYPQGLLVTEALPELMREDAAACSVKADDSASVRLRHEIEATHPMGRVFLSALQKPISTIGAVTQLDLDRLRLDGLAGHLLTKPPEAKVHVQHPVSMPPSPKPSPPTRSRTSAQPQCHDERPVQRQTRSLPVKCTPALPRLVTPPPSPLPHRRRQYHHQQHQSQESSYERRRTELQSLLQRKVAFSRDICALVSGAHFITLQLSAQASGIRPMAQAEAEQAFVALCKIRARIQLLVSKILAVERDIERVAPIVCTPRRPRGLALGFFLEHLVGGVGC